MHKAEFGPRELDLLLDEGKINFDKLSLKQRAQVRASMLDRQDGKCAICGQVSARMALDHCHDSGRVRAVLCMYCNLGLGSLKDSPHVLARALVYLEEHGKYLD